MLPLISALLPVIDKLVGFIPDTNAREAEKAALTKQIMDIVAAQDTQQSDVNKVEAASSSVFVAGWRPAIGWVCAASFAWFYLGAPIVQWVLAIFGVHAPMPVFNSDALMQLTYGMLGMGALRSFDKWKGQVK